MADMTTSPLIVNDERVSCSHVHSHVMQIKENKIKLLCKSFIFNSVKSLDLDIDV